MMNKELKKLIKKENVILFVGAGVSASLGLPNWSQLIEKLSKDLRYDSRVFAGYGESLALAEYYEIKEGLEGLREWMQEKWNISKDEIKKSKIHEYIARLKFPIVYTTNYDHCLEQAFKVWGNQYKKVVYVDDIVKIRSDRTQLIKLHGDMTDEKTIVLTEKSYFDRLDFETPLDMKLRSDILGKSILFIGYSLTDINIRLLIYKLDKIWDKANNGSSRPKLYIFLPTANPIQTEILKKRGIETIVGEGLDPKESLEKFLEELL